ncbi:MAG: 2-oxo acid dehydrogenase subunit E2 [Victivallales bacterium]|nr:2-oxo acid dehydrogenase subunit E2 [Victivallales bacterium]
MQQRLTIPGLGENIEHAQVVRVLVEVGQDLAADQSVVELEAGKATVEVPAESAGTVVQILVSEGDEVDVGQAFLVLEASEGTPAATAPAAPAAPEPKPTPVAPVPAPDPSPEPPPKPPASKQPVRHVPAAPSVRRFAREIGIDVDTVEGTGSHGRVSLDDVKHHARELSQRRSEGLRVETPQLPDFSQWGTVRREPMSGIRRATAEHLAVSWTNVPRVTHFDSADITTLDSLRKKFADRAAAQGGKLTMAVMVVKTVAEALKKFPKFNASIDVAKREIVFKDYIHIGIAVATERGLMVPVLRDAGGKNMVQLAAEIDAVATRCREGKISLPDLAGGTFTVTNLGAIGGSYFTPIVNYPEAAILGLGRAKRQPVVDENGGIVVRTILPLSLSYDHRLIDGAEAARFVRWVAEAIEEPLLLSLEGGS